MIYSILGVVALLIVFVVYNAIQTQNLVLEKTIEINSGKEKVYTLVSNLHNFYQWSPYLHNDPALVYKVKDSNNKLGTELLWTGGKEGEDIGKMTLIDSKEFEIANFKCDIDQPFEAHSTFNYSFKEIDGKTVVTQIFQMESPFMNALFMWIFGAKKEINSNNQLALDLLKESSEKQ